MSSSHQFFKDCIQAPIGHFTLSFAQSVGYRPKNVSSTHVSATSKIDYGNAIYDQTSRHLLKLLYPVQNEGLRTALCSYRHSPKPGVETEANVVSQEGIYDVLSICTSSSTLCPLLDDITKCTFRWPCAEVVRRVFDTLHLSFARVLSFSFTHDTMVVSTASNLHCFSFPVQIQEYII